ncbi:GNAT family N-acetyltransferase [Oscillospiraceae bacterium LTW-04]|nr:GNAT family N-acetyltransferase [Oscillospiraceae bacterium MB24-C1]
MEALQIISFTEKARWNGIVKSFSNYDVYYLHEYVSAFRYAGDGNPYLIYYSGDRMRLCYTVLHCDIAKSYTFEGILEKGCYYDIATPYGYGGPLVTHYSQKEMRRFFALFKAYCNENGIISQFIRFHPLLGNEVLFADYCELCSIKKTVFVDIADRETVYANLESRCRGAIQKARKTGIQIKIDNSDEAKATFIRLYSETMQRLGAASYYFFNGEFFDDFFLNMAGYYNLFCAMLEGQIVSAAIILCCNLNIHYHLSGSDEAFQRFSPNNLLLYTAACWGADNGYKKFHLGGGVEADDSLFLFKKSFNKEGQLDFYIGRSIFSDEKLRSLVKLRVDCDPDFDPQNGYMIQYRA